MKQSRWETGLIVHLIYKAFIWEMRIHRFWCILMLGLSPCQQSNNIVVGCLKISKVILLLFCFIPPWCHRLCLVISDQIWSFLKGWGFKNNIFTILNRSYMKAQRSLNKVVKQKYKWKQLQHWNVSLILSTTCSTCGRSAAASLNMICFKMPQNFSVWLKLAEFLSLSIITTRCEASFTTQTFYIYYKDTRVKWASFTLQNLKCA